MSTVVASCTPMCRSPVLPASSGKRPASRSWRPAASFPTPVGVKCRRPLSVTCALPEKQRPAFSIAPTALLYPVPPPDGKERWDIKEEEDHVKLWFQVPGLSEQDLEINVSEDMLEIKRKGAKVGGGDGEAPTEVHGVGSFHIRLLMTKEYDSNKVTAELKAGMLEVTVGKSKQRSFHRVGLGHQSPTQGPKSQGPVLDPAQGAKVPQTTDMTERRSGPVPPNTVLNQTQRYAVPRADPVPPNTGLNQTQRFAVPRADPVPPNTGLNQTQSDAAVRRASPNQQAQGDAVQRAAQVPPNTALIEAQGDAAVQRASPNQQAQGDATVRSASPNQQAQGDAVQRADPVPPNIGLNQTQRDVAVRRASPNQQAQGDAVQRAAPVPPNTGLIEAQGDAAVQRASPNQQAQGDDVQRAGQDQTQRGARK